MKRLCKKCGWEFPNSFTKSKCKFCGTEFDYQHCSKCDGWFPLSEFYRYKSGRNKGCLNKVCKKCTFERKRIWDKLFPEQNLERVKRFMNERRRVADSRYADWVDMTNIKFKPMTEQQWIEACRYFDGCAICGAEEIEVREFFIPFQQGGRYTAWNMFPMCGKCAVHTKSSGNPFIWLDRYLGYARKLGLNEYRQERLIEYMLLQIERCRDE